MAFRFFDDIIDSFLEGFAFPLRGHGLGDQLAVGEDVAGVGYAGAVLFDDVVGEGEVGAVVFFEFVDHGAVDGGVVVFYKLWPLQELLILLLNNPLFNLLLRKVENNRRSRLILTTTTVDQISQVFLVIFFEISFVEEEPGGGVPVVYNFFVRNWFPEIIFCGGFIFLIGLFSGHNWVV